MDLLSQLIFQEGQDKQASLSRKSSRSAEHESRREQLCQAVSNHAFDIMLWCVNFDKSMYTYAHK